MPILPTAIHHRYRREVDHTQSITLAAVEPRTAPTAIGLEQLPYQ
jgi:hypothetical protein